MANRIIEKIRQRAAQSGRRGLRRRPPKWQHPNSAEREYRRELIAMLNDIQEQVKKLLLERLEQLSKDASLTKPRADSWVDDVQSIMEQLTLFSATRAAGASREASRVADMVNGFNKGQFKRIANAVFGVDIITAEPWLADSMKSFAAQNSTLIKSIPEKYLSEIDGIAQRGFQQGTPTREIAKEIQARFEVTKSRAELIAVDQVSKLNANLTQLRQTELGIEEYVWQTAGDEAVRDDHRAMEGLICRWDDPNVYREQGDKEYKNRTGSMVHLHPGEDYRCFPGNLNVNGFSLPDKVYRRLYSGELSNIVFDDGTILSSTPNHPILTTAGLKPAHLVDKSDNVIKQIDNSFSGIYFNGESFNPSFEEIFSSLVLNGATVAVSPGKASQFHGDGSDQEINIVEIDSLLISMADSFFDKKLPELGLSYSDVMAFNTVLSCFGNKAFLLERYGDSFGSFMSRANLVKSLLFAHLSPLQKFCLTLISNIRPAGDERFSNDASGDIHNLGNMIFAFAVLIHGDDFVNGQFERLSSGCVGSGIYPSIYSNRPEALPDFIGADPKLGRDFFNADTGRVKICGVVDNFTSDFSGHVYNLQTVAGHYIANSVIVGNCRCFPAPVLDKILEEVT